MSSDVTADRERLAELADEQAALRRIATLVARGVPAAEIFDAVAEEVHRLWHPDVTILVRREPDGTWTILAVRGTESGVMPVGLRMDDDEVVPGLAQILSGRPTRVDARPVGTAQDHIFRAERMKAWIGGPITLMEQTWGVIWIVSRRGPLPIGAEDRLAAFAELVATGVANAESQAQLMASRARIVAAADEERRRVVRDLHDGAQQRLVHTIVTLKLALGALQQGRQDAAGLVREALEHAETANEELRDLAHGILPSVLTRGGLRAAVRALASTMSIPVEIDVSVDRFPAAFEATAYFIVAGALTNIAKHSRAQRAEVTVRMENGRLELRIRDDGVGGARPDGSGLVGLRDRVEAIGGTMTIDSPNRRGTTLVAKLPLDYASAPVNGPRPGITSPSPAGSTTSFSKNV